MLYLVAEPFGGTMVSTLTDDVHVDYSGYLENDGGSNLTLDAYREKTGRNVRAVTQQEFDVMVADHCRQMVTEPVEIDVEDYDYALDVLPPCRFGDVHGVRMFHVSERINYNMVNWYTQVHGRYFTFVDVANRSREELAGKVLAVANAVSGQEVQT